MQNKNTCSRCNTENALFRLNCTKCNNYLRKKVWNLDLWHVIREIVDSPSEAFKEIIWSEHKNFLVLLLLVLSIKFMIDSFFLSMVVGTTEFLEINLFLSFFVVLLEVLFFFFLFAFIITKINASLSIETRFKDNLTILIYSFLPSFFALIILFPMEIILYGSNLFSLNPSPFVIKSVLAYFLSFLEISLIGWSIFLIYKGFLINTDKKAYSLFIAFIFTTLFLLTLLATPFSIL